MPEKLLEAAEKVRQERAREMDKIEALGKADKDFGSATVVSSLLRLPAEKQESEVF